MKKTCLFILSGIFLFRMGTYSFAQDNHPVKNVPQTTPVSKELSAGELAAAVKNHVEKETKKNNGSFLLKDDSENRMIKMVLSNVHDNRLIPVGKDSYVVCAEFKAQDGSYYDVDFTMKGASLENFITAETVLHAVNGKERYQWVEENGIWKKKLE